MPELLSEDAVAAAGVDERIGEAEGEHRAAIGIVAGIDGESRDARLRQRKVIRSEEVAAPWLRIGANDTAALRGEIRGRHAERRQHEPGENKRQPTAPTSAGAI